ncbi:MAG: dNTP triphosphohydrolase [Candidatus Sulfotelmatobacter sp.]
MSRTTLRSERLHDKNPRTDGDDRTPAQRDRDRILYSSSFRRLAEVTQVVSASSGYVFHNRLTHSLQVAQVGRRLAEKLCKKYPALTTDLICPDVVEAACLAHDLGHPPFGHVAEHRLNELAKAYGGFEGNAQSFRIVSSLASRSRSYAGLDLTAATLAAILKYPWLKGDNPGKLNKWGAYASESRSFRHAAQLFLSINKPTIEAELMDWADDVTYSVHDLEDFYRAGRLPLHLLAHRDPRERESFFENVFERRKDDPDFSARQDLKEAFTDIMLWTFSVPGAYDGSSLHRAALRTFTGILIGRYINAATLDAQGDSVSLTIDPDLRAEVRMLKELTWTYVIEAPSLAARQCGQNRIIEELFMTYRIMALDPKDWLVFPTFYRERLKDANGKPEEVVRTCVDLIASMTESQAVAMHHRLTGQKHSSGLDDILQ